MRHSTCQECSQQRPMNETFEISGRTLCKDCAEKELQKPREGKAETERLPVARMIDPTVCAYCGTDYGSTELPRAAQLPACERCTRSFRDRRFPAWIKATFVGLLALAAFSFFWNLRFFAAHVAAVRAGHALREGNVDVAAEEYRIAARNVPELAALQFASDFYSGLQLLHQDRAKEAIPLLKRSAVAAPNTPAVRFVLVRAEADAAFDDKDYDTFLAKEQELRRLEPKHAIVIAGVASAYACKYAVTGDEQFRNEALKLLKEASVSKEGNSPAFKEYEERIRHRLATREILDADEYNKKYRQSPAQQEK